MLDLNKIRQQEPFKVPEKYFSSMEDRVMERIQPRKEENKINWIDRIVYQLQLRFSIPSIMVTALALIVIYISLDQEREKLVFSDQEIKNFLLEEYDESTEAQILALTIEPTEELILTDDDLIEYLDEDNIELELIDEYLP